jgi:hypothetical protein
MRRLSTLTVFVLCAALTVGGAAFAQKSMEGKVFGKGVSAQDATPISKILDDPAGFEGKTVRIQGTVVGTCMHRGCWIAIASDREGETLRVQVPDGVIVFPPEIVGEPVIAEGVFTINKLDLETTKKVCEAKANQAGEEFNPDEVVECMTTYAVNGTGAVVLAQADVEHADAHDGQEHN